MAQYAQYNPAISPAPVIGWYDTGEFTYHNLPPASDLLEVTAAEWAARVSNPSGWAVSNGALVAYTPPVPPPTLAQQATAALSAGLAITSTGTPALDATYLYDQSIATQQLAETTSIILNGTFADGAATIEWPYTTGAAVTMTIAEFKVIVTTIAAWVSALTKCINGQSTTLPASSVTIS